MERQANPSTISKVSAGAPTHSSSHKVPSSPLQALKSKRNCYRKQCANRHVRASAQAPTTFNPPPILTTPQPSAPTTTTPSCSSSPSCLRLPSPGRTLKQDPTGAGCLHLGSDGVLRSYAGDGSVLDYRPLSPAQIAEHVAVFRATGVYDAEQMEQIEAGYRGADGRDVPLERCVEPGDEQRPVHLRGKQKRKGDEDR